MTRIARPDSAIIASLLLCGAILPLAACGSAPPPPAIIVAPSPSDAELVKAAMPSIVLVVNSRDDGKTTYGAGFFSAPGRVLTAFHVVEDKGHVAIMTFVPDRASYSPMDGGIMRFLFENVSDLVPARLVKSDAVRDLAALGHPQETPWSFSAGVVGALQYGLIQHDATVGPGSSGGPLLNLRGEVVGVNVAQVVSEPVGLSFARPASVVASAVGDAGTHDTAIDLYSATSSALSCWRAQELALQDAADCFDWETEWRQYLVFIEEAAKHVSQDDVRARILECGRAPETKERWIAKRREHVVRALDPTIPKEKEPALDPSDPDLPPEIGLLLRDAQAEWKKIAEASGSFESDFHDVPRLRSRLRQGLRVEDTRRVAPEAEWVLLGSRNSDGTVARFSELYVKVGDRWVQRATPWPEEVARLPHGWPEPMESYARRRSFTLAYIIKYATRGDVCSPSPQRSTEPG